MEEDPPLRVAGAYHSEPGAPLHRVTHSKPDGQYNLQKYEFLF
jgi:hypothetical protein